MKHPAARRHGDPARGAEQRVEKLARLRTLVRASDLSDPDAAKKSQPSVRRLNSDALFGLIGDVALERTLTDAEVVVEPHCGFAFCRRRRDRKQERALLRGGRRWRRNHQSKDDEEAHGHSQSLETRNERIASARGPTFCTTAATVSIPASDAGAPRTS